MTKIQRSQHEDVARLYRSGLTQSQVAAQFNVSSGLISQILKSIGTATHGADSGKGVGKAGAYKRVAPVESHAVMVDAYKDGRTLKSIASDYGISRERVRQILSAHGLSRCDGGKSTQMFLDTDARVAKARVERERAEHRIRATWDMSVEAYDAHVEQFGNTCEKTSPMRKYVQHRRNAKDRGIGWKFTFASWWRVWEESGKWMERGRGLGYVMARYGDGDTPYSEDTVYICTQAQNASDSYIVMPASERFSASAGRTAGTGLGYTILKDCKSKPYMAQFAGKILGYFPTAEQARAAYLAAYKATKAV